MNLRTTIKTLAASKDVTLTQLATALYNNEAVQHPTQNLTNKIKRDTIRFNEVVQILDLLGYDVIFQDRETKQTIIID